MPGIVSGTSTREGWKASPRWRTWQRGVINEETTKQELLRAEASARVEAIRQEGALLLGYLDRSFDVRKVLFARLLDALHLSSEAGATDEVASIAGAIISLAVKSPFADLKDVAAVGRDSGFG